MIEIEFPFLTKNGAFFWPKVLNSDEDMIDEFFQIKLDKRIDSITSGFCSWNFILNLVNQFLFDGKNVDRVFKDGNV